jgi:hypothetical protein
MENLEGKIISISGNARCGKDTLGNNIVSILEDLGIKAKTLSFAYELKSSVDSFLLEQTGISAFTDDDTEKSIIRPFLVCWGTDVMRSIDNNIWINKLEESLSTDSVNIITDLRFENELDWIKSEKGFSIMLKRDGIKPANDYEEVNNSQLSNNVDLSFCIGSFDDEKILKLTSMEILDQLITEKTFDLWKATCPL